MIKLGMNVLNQLSSALGDNDFIMGGSEPTLVDSTVFGFLSQMYYLSGPESEFLGPLTKDERFANLKGHTERMRARFWPDWEEIKFRGAVHS